MEITFIVLYISHTRPMSSTLKAAEIPISRQYRSLYIHNLFILLLVHFRALEAAIPFP
jgi:hypothetical protein